MKELEDKIREALPHLKELSVGLRFIDDLGFEAKIVNMETSIDYYSESDREIFNTCDMFFDTICSDIIGRDIMLNDVLLYIEKTSKFKELFYYFCSSDEGENNESTDSFETNLKDYKEVFKDLYFDKEEGYHPDYDGDILYKAVVKTSIFETEADIYNHKFIIEPKEYIIRYWDLNSPCLKDQNDKLINFLNEL